MTKPPILVAKEDYESNQTDPEETLEAYICRKYNVHVAVITEHGDVLINRTINDHNGWQWLTCRQCSDLIVELNQGTK